MIQPTPELQGLLKALRDPTRLRILALTEIEEISVGELSRALSMSQSRVSNHLRVLRESGLVLERHVGTSHRLRCALASDGSLEEQPYPVRVWQGLREGLTAMPEHQADRSRLSDLLALRRAEGAREYSPRTHHALSLSLSQRQEQQASTILDDPV